MTRHKIEHRSHNGQFENEGYILAFIRKHSYEIVSDLIAMYSTECSFTCVHELLPFQIRVSPIVFLPNCIHFLADGSGVFAISWSGTGTEEKKM